MNDLARLQHEFQSYLLNRDTSVELRLVGTREASATERLAVYGTSYRLRLGEALETDFPALKGLLGDAEFERLVQQYVDAFPSRHASLRWFGRHLEIYLRDTSPYRAQPVLAEMASFEWAQGEVFDGPDSAAVTESDVAALALERWAGMTLVFQPTLRRLQLRWNAPALWQAINDDQVPPPQIQQTERAVDWAVWRKELNTFWRSLEHDEAWAISSAIGGEPFGAICEGLGRWHAPEDTPLRAAGLLRQWVCDRMVSHIEPGNVPNDEIV